MRTSRATAVGSWEVHRREALGWRFGIVLASAVVAMGFAVWGLSTSLAADESSVLPRIEAPSVVGISGDEARRQLESLGFVTNLRSQPNEVVPVGVAFDQTPPAGTKVEQGGVVDVSVSDGPLGVIVPSAIGQSVADGAALMTANGLGSTIVDEFDEATPPGVVLRSQPDAGGRVDINGTVTLVVSAGPAPRTMPEVVGKPIEQVLVGLGRAGLAVGELRHEERDGIPPGVVVDAQYAPGASLPRDMPVDLTIAGTGTGGGVSVPFLVGLRQSGAQVVLRSLGIGLDVTTQQVDPATGQVGRVITQSVAPGQRISKGTAISVTVGV